MNTVRDIMNTDLVTVSPDTTVHDLTRLLSEHDISGAPVVGIKGEVLGVVSMTDVIRLAADETDMHVGGHPVADDSSTSVSDDEEADVLEYFQHGHTPMPGSNVVGDWVAESDLDQYEVREIMTPANFHIHPDASLAELSRFLLRGRIHRALVMEDETLAGIVTTVDVLRTVAEGS
jgi:CBS domain-containing protein